jgi:putrescine transport system permease protein
MKKLNILSWGVLAFGLLFLYVPIFIVIVFSFNSSRLVTVWGGFSTKWYISLSQNTALLEAAELSVFIALVAASLATIFGTMAAFALSRSEWIIGRSALFGMTAAPLIMPEVITGLSLLLLFVALNFERGFLTVCIAHVTLTMCYVTVIVHSRLAVFDRDLEDAARDLGATPWRVVSQVTLPLIFPAVAVSWMLAFSLSMDDLVIASFTTGPSATTLPMRIYSAAHLGVSPEINAASTILIAVVGVLVICSSISFKAGNIRV